MNDSVSITWDQPPGAECPQRGTDSVFFLVLEDFVDQTILFRLQRRHEIITIGIFFDTVDPVRTLGRWLIIVAAVLLSARAAAVVDRRVARWRHYQDRRPGPSVSTEEGKKFHVFFLA